MENLDEVYYMYRMNDAYAQKKLIGMMQSMVKTYVFDLYQRKAIPTGDWEDVVAVGVYGVQKGLEEYRYDKGCTLITYCLLLAKRMINNEIRAQYAFKRKIDRCKVSLDVVAEDRTSVLYGKLPRVNGMECPEYYARYSLSLDEVRKCIKEFTPIQQEVFRCCMDNYTADETCTELGISRAVYSRALTIVRMKVKKSLYA